MKIGIITAGVLPVPAVQGGAVENLLDFCLEYNDHHTLHDITVYSIWHPDVEKHPAQKSKVNHYRYINMNSYVAKVMKQLFKRLRKSDDYYHYSVEYFLQQSMRHACRQPYDVIIVENRPGFVLKLTGNTSARLVIHQENDYLNPQVRQYQQIYDATSRIINTSAYITRCVQAIAADDTKCRTVLNGIDTQRFYNAKPQSREQIGLKDDDFVLVFNGRLTPEKGVLELIQAIRQLSTIPNLKLLIIGASFYGHDKTPSPFIKSLEEETRAVRNKVLFTGYIDYTDIPSYLKMADISVLPSMWEEPFGLTIAEAMAAGLPLITTRCGGIPEICEGVATILERDHIVEHLATSILDLYHHPEKRERMSQASLERSKLFDKEIYAKNYFAAIE